jgi:hypothetical protein
VGGFAATPPARRFAAGRLARVLALAVLVFAMPAAAGPVEVYREGPRFCPRDRPADAPRLTEQQAIERARTLLPSDFCAKSRFVSGCDATPEFALGSWRIYFLQYKLRGTMHDAGGLSHTYVVLDPVGNCNANIPGTEVGAPR